jgi:hypothetical protein
MGDKTGSFKAASSKTKEAVWSYRQFIAMLGIVAAIAATLLTIQSNARDELREDFTARIEYESEESGERIEEIGGWLLECRDALAECNRWFRQSMTEKIVDVVPAPRKKNRLQDPRIHFSSVAPRSLLTPSSEYRQNTRIENKTEGLIRDLFVVTTAILNHGNGYQPRSNLTGADGWFNTSIYGAFSDIAGGNLQAITIDPTATSDVRFFSFVDNAPVFFGCFGLYLDAGTVTDDNAVSGGDVHTDPAVRMYPEAPMSNLRATATVQAWTMFTAVSGRGTINDHMMATTTTNGLTVAGRGFTVAMIDHGQVDDMGAALTFSLLLTDSQHSSGVCDSPAFMGSDDNILDTAGLYIPENDYTAAIRAAGNTFTDNAGTVWPIVGLYELVAR